MTSTPKHRNRYKVAEAKQQMRDKIGTDKVEIELDDGTVIEFPHPLFYPAELKRELRALEEDDSEGVALALLGEEQFDRFVADGQDPDDLQYVIQAVSEDAQDKLAGRKRPTRS